ncbi:S41 family peptidase [Marinirhabdus gelatinilytica]|uniref:Peptidase S41-like protein n=1 Tax=Marinirhabdus gelatinilytica TaxID=1703343 RepID=A0A370QFP6_9FLAO|nr:S41 family peptidase [Marinirhabdus gelatinilytica]RDK87188.1 peptidase S41-like protein [Marinirhabdus gelatinilytica]
MLKKKSILLVLLCAVLFTSCFKDNDDELTSGLSAEVSSEIKDFIYRGLNFFYLYKADTPELANDFFANDAEKNTFLESFDSPEALFDFLESPVDRFSFVTDDYVELINALNGVTENNGMEYGLILYPDGSGNVFGYVRYILPNTDAEAKGLERGIIFNRVDGQQITEDNFRELLEPTTYTIGLAEFEGENIVEINETVTLTKAPYTENPVFIANTLTVENQPIGYLMYNAFTRDFDPELNAAFAQFQADGITELIIDLRYNGGGSVSTATDLAGMITGQFQGQVFYNEQWNEDRQEEYAEPGLFDGVLTTGEALNSLNLTRVYVITTGRTASASELVINGLSPYIDVIQVGATTTGKFQASFLLFDAPAPAFSFNEANPNHTYAMLPLVFKTVNVNGVTDYTEGLDPDVLIPEDYSNLGVLGDEREPLLEACLAEIFPGRSSSKQPVDALEEVGESKQNSPLHQLMLAENQ